MDATSRVLQRNFTSSKWHFGYYDYLESLSLPLLYCAPGSPYKLILRLLTLISSSLHCNEQFVQQTLFIRQRFLPFG
ncbi:hypothetical protein F0562_027436 [Nyssa sinensis]|uniref:Uncharacterized protein n=1 Tax=Nyssa sinensis TaxID=561372 RepID=A0A5J5B603_9ASTE|nr:hypothetical protein F0562_027436 [Nyssa sinensis]